MTQPEKSALTPEMRAAQIWCLPAFSSREMDASFAQAIADAIREAVAAEREIVAAWMLACSYATGPGDTIADLLKELLWQIDEREVWVVAAERERCAKIADPPLMHRKGRPGIWRRRRARIAADIRALPSENESLG